MTTSRARPDYGSYLKTKELLDLQSPLSNATETGQPVHDEMLFIITHQTYELWFKQILWELDSILAVLSQTVVPEDRMGLSVHRLHRVREIFRLLIDQISVLETMTPLDFLDFRSALFPASGFQSVQFRLFENRLGLRRDQRLVHNNEAYTAALDDSSRKTVERSEQEPSLFECVNRWLERAPFLSDGDFQFWRAFEKSVEGLLVEEESLVQGRGFDPQTLERNLKEIAANREKFQCLLDPKKFERLRADGSFRMSHRALLAALLIHLYRDEPLLALPFQLLSALQDIDELVTTWRYRHALLAHRMLGRKVGTGGSSGHDYLKASTDHHRIFVDLFNLTTFLIPSSRRPKLPESLLSRLRFSGVQSS